MPRSDRGDGSFEQPACEIFIQSNKKSDYATCTQDLINVSLIISTENYTLVTLI